MEDLEQLKVLENGYKMRVVVVDHCAHGVDEPEDVAVVEAALRDQQGHDLSPVLHVLQDEVASNVSVLSP